MISDVDLQALRDCCRDEAAFERLQQILTHSPLAHLAEHEGMYQLQARLDALEEPFAQPQCTEASFPQELAAINAALERRLMEATLQLQQQSVELQNLKRNNEMLLHTLAHDVRTSLMGVSLVFQNLLSQCDATIALPRPVVERIMEGSDRQLSLINSLLETQNHDQRGMILHPEPMDFYVLTQEITQELEPLLREKQASFINQVAIDLPAVMVDPLQLHQVFESLFTSRLKHSSPGITFTLNAEVISSGAQTTDPMLRCTITDNGTGISARECSRLFNLPIQNPRSCCPTNVGLKLYLCRQIITAHGGQIGVTSSQKQGATVWFTLPLVPL
jgi:signal transduction histidine kinase